MPGTTLFLIKTCLTGGAIFMLRFRSIRSKPRHI